MNCIITEGNIEAPKVLFADVVIAHVRGEGVPRKPRNVQYEHKETGEKYSCLAGGFAWPGIKPGFACVVAVLAGPDPYKPAFKVVAEVEDSSIESLIERSHELYQQWGANCKVIRWLWYGEPDRARSSFLHRFNEKLRREGVKEHFFLASPPHVDQPDRFEFYSRTLSSLLLRGEKRLLWGEDSSLPASLKNVKPSEGVTGTTKDHPAVSALGFVVSALIYGEPWLMRTHDPGPVSLERLMLREQDRTARLLRTAFEADDESLLFDPCGGVE